MPDPEAVSSVSVKLAPPKSPFLRCNDRPESVITTSSIVSNTSVSSGSAEEPTTLYAMSGLYNPQSIVKSKTLPPGSIPPDGATPTTNTHRRMASTPVQLSLLHGNSSSGAVGGSNGKSAYIPGHRRSQSHGHHRLPQSCCIHGHRRTGSSVIETLQTFSCGSTEHCYERENSLAQFLENLKKEQQS
ncbi:Solute carrier organic anion transporter family member 5A1like, partial [Caligus rogercresseyi]